MTELCPDAVATIVFSGSDKTWAIRFKGQDTLPIDLTGSVGEIVEVDPLLASRLTPSIPTPTDGTLYVSLEGSPPLPVGRYPFRARAAGPVDRASPLIIVVVK